MSEVALRRRLCQVLKPLHARPVENRVEPGTPDLSYAHGWIELKKLKQWPRNPEAIVRVPIFTREQRIWLRQRWQAGGLCWLLLQVRQELVLLPGLTAATFLGTSTRAQLYSLARAHWGAPLKVAEKDLLHLLTGERR